jgi:hypothetical protein
MRKAAGPRWRALVAELGRVVDGLPPDEAVAAAGGLEELLRKARAVALERAILESVAAHPGASSNALVLAVRGDRARVLRKLRELERSGLLKWEPGPKGSRLWYAGKTGRAYQPVRRCA